jgi:hypothetical protein
MSNNSMEKDDILLESPDFTFMGLKFKTNAKKQEPGSVVPPVSDDGSFISVATGTHQIAYHRDFAGYDNTDISRIRRYREISQYPECEQAISEIVNEAIISDDEQNSIELSIESDSVPKKLQKAILSEFEHIARLLDFELSGHDLFRDWYIDGRLVFHVIVNEKQDQIIELRKIDPVNIRKVKEIQEMIDSKSGAKTYKVLREYFIYQEQVQSMKGRTQNVINQEIEIHKDAIIFVPSGLLDEERKNVISYLHRSIKTVNQLRMLEDAQVVYRLVRAPERRVFYIDVGNLPTSKAEAYLQSVISKFRNKIVYDGITGEIKDARQQIAMVEDFWLPRRSGGSGTDVQTLAGQTNQGAQEDLEYFQKKLFRSLNVPLQRLVQETGFSIGRASEVTREEVKFAKLINRLRRKFSSLFIQALRIQLRLRKLVSEKEWEDDIRPFLRVNFLRDNYYAELKETEILRERLSLMNDLDQHIGKYFSKRWVRETILKQSPQDIDEMDKEIKKEKEDGEYDDEEGIGGEDENNAPEDETNDNENLPDVNDLPKPEDIGKEFDKEINPKKDDGQQEEDIEDNMIWEKK